MKNYEQFVCMSGMPRSGSTLLSSILCQNPKIHSEGNSAVCQLMWDMEQSLLKNCNEQIKANKRENTINELIAKIPEIYYNNIEEDEKIVIDKCRSWTIPDNVNLLKKYIDKNIKIIVLERSILNIINSFHKIYTKNNKTLDINALLNPNSEPVMRSLNGLIHAKQNNGDNTFLFINYNDLTEDPEKTIKKIYDFCNWDYFEHDFNNIQTKYIENDEAYGLKDFHHVHSSIKKADQDITLLDDIREKCMNIDNMLLNIDNVLLDVDKL